MSLQTAIKLTQSEEVLISEAMRMPVLSLSFPSPPTYSDYFGAEGPTDRLTVELGRLLDGTEMRTRIATIAEGAGLEFDGEASDDGVSVLLCKVVEVSLSHYHCFYSPLLSLLFFSASFRILLKI